MPGIIGRATTYDLPNYVGELFNLTPTDTPMLSIIGGLTGGDDANGSTEHAWTAYDLRDAAQRTRLEGDDAPPAEERVRLQFSNVLQIVQEAVDVSYTKQAAVNQLSGVNNGQVNPVRDELAFQIRTQLQQVALDTEFSYLRGHHLKPQDNTQPRCTRGLIEATPAANIITAGDASTSQAITGTASTDKISATAHGYSNGDQVVFTGLTSAAPSGLYNSERYYVVSKTTDDFKVALTPGGTAIDIVADISAGEVTKAAALSADRVVDALQLVWEAGGLRTSETATLFCDGNGKRALTKAFITDAGYKEGSRNVGGVSVDTIQTDFGVLNVVMSRVVKGYVQIASLDQCTPVFLPIPGKGHLFVEELARTGSATKMQLYGELGLAYGNPNGHGQIVGTL